MNAHELLQVFPRHRAVDTDFCFSGVEIDSRKSCAGCLFVALKGASFDGHRFIQEAVRKGATAVLTETELKLEIPQIVVDDTRIALAMLANYWRKKINPLLVSITGSNGKTTVKEMLGQILSSQAQTLVTPGNFNNDIGVPLTLFKLSEQDRYAVIEMGANHANEIRSLVGIAEPDVVYVNNAQAAHIEGFGSLQGVVEAKGEMYRYCDTNTLAVFNQDDPSFDYWQSTAVSARSLKFSSHVQSDVRGEGRAVVDGLSLSVNYAGQHSSCRLTVSGEHNVQNALAAITLAIACGLTLQQSTAGLNGYGGVPGRQQFVNGLNRSLIIDDSYNANPASLQAALKVLCALDGTPWLALGDMAELGDESLRLHQEAARSARAMGVIKFFALGSMSCTAASVFDENGHCFQQHEEMAEHIRKQLHPGINLLIKGSRSAGMEKVVALLTETARHAIPAGGRHAV